MQSISWEIPFNTTYGVLTLPVDCILYRGYNPKWPISSYPSFFGSKDTAESYAGLEGRKLGAFRLRRPLKVLDIRFMKQILTELFAKHKNESTNSMIATILAFGLCSLYHQIELAKMRFQNHTNDQIKAMKQMLTNTLVEQQGIRIAETNNDGEVMIYLSKIFENFVDGFISPRLETPFHIEKNGSLNPELILFNPISCNLELLPTPDPIIARYISIRDICVSQFGAAITIGNSNEIKDSFFIQRGGRKAIQLPTLEQFQELLVNKNKQALKIAKEANKNGMNMKKNASYFLLMHPHPKVPIMPFIIT